MSNINFEINPFKAYNNSWALVTSGNRNHFNTMTIGWGGFGILWNKDVATIYVKPIRYTFNFLKENDYYTITFYDEKYREDLAILGSKSGKDVDKVALTKLTPIEYENSMSFSEAKLVLYCKKIYMSKLDPTQIPKEVHDHYYTDEEEHYMIVGEILKIEEDGIIKYQMNQK